MIFQKSNLETLKVAKHPPEVAPEEGETPRREIGRLVSHSTWSKQCSSQSCRSGITGSWESRSQLYLSLDILLNPNPCCCSIQILIQISIQIKIFMTKINYLTKIRHFLYLPKPLQRTYRLQEKPPAHQRTLQTWNFFIFFRFNTYVLLFCTKFPI